MSKTTHESPQFLKMLSAATEHWFGSVRVLPTDYLFLELNEKGTHFLAEVKYCKDADDDSGSFIPASYREKLAAQGGKTRDGRTVRATQYHPSVHARECLNRLPECESQRDAAKQGNRRRRLAATDVNVMLLTHVFGHNIIFEDELAETTFNFVLRRFTSQNFRAEVQAQFKQNGIVPEMPPAFRDHPKMPLSDYQQTAVAMAFGQECLALHMDPGTGKTATTIGLICAEARRQIQGLNPRDRKNRMYRALIVVPRQVRQNWVAEFGKFATIPGKVTVLRGGKPKRIKALTDAIRGEEDCAFTAVIISYDTLVNDLDHMMMVPWDRMVADESHYFKAPRSKRFLAMQKMRKKASSCLQLTGTPIANSVNDLFGQFEILAPGMSGFGTFTGFRKFHGIYEEAYGAGGTPVEKLVGQTNIPLLQERLARVTFSITKEEAGLKLPDKTSDIYEVEMTSFQAKAYRQLANDLLQEIEEALEAEVNTEHILTKLLRLTQITSGFMRVDSLDAALDGKHQDRDVCKGPNPKLEGLLEMLAANYDNDPNCKTIVWFNFVYDINLVSEALTKAGIQHVQFYGATSDVDREKAIHDFNNDPNCRVFLANPKAAGAGLNLLGYDPNTEEDQETYCGQVIFYSTNWSAVERAQAEDRAHRRGTKMPVRVTDLVVPGTIDQEIRDAVEAKRNNASAVQDIREILSSILKGVE